MLLGRNKVPETKKPTSSNQWIIHRCIRFDAGAVRHYIDKSEVRCGEPG